MNKHLFFVAVAATLFVFSSTPAPSQNRSAQTGKEPEAAPQKQPQYTTEQIAALKEARARAIKMNALITQAMTAMNAKNWQEALDPLQQLVVMDPNSWQYYSSLGDVQLNLGKYDEAVKAYDSGIHAAESNTTVDPKDPSSDPAKKKIGVARMLTNEGNAYFKLRKTQEAVAAYMKAAALDPNPGVAYFNLCAVQFNNGQVEGALDVCKKAIQADPNKAEAYFILGSLLMAESKTDKEGKIIAPPGTVEILSKYLELAPDGPHANEVKTMLSFIGAKVETSYQKNKK